MFEAPKIWYPAASTHNGAKVEPSALAHILWHGVFLCRTPMSYALRDAKVKKGVIRSGVIPGNPMCQKCQDAYKSNPEFPYQKWVGKSQDKCHIV
jgi:hypothetical protein